MARAKTLKDSDGQIIYPVTKAAITFLSDNQTDVETALDQKVNSSELGKVAFSDDYGDLVNKPTKVSEFENDAEYETKTEVAADIVEAVQPINEAIDKSFADFFQWNNSDANDLSLRVGFRNIVTGLSTREDYDLPIASGTRTGVMNSTTYNTVQDNADKIAAILGGSVAIEGLSATVTQPELTAAWKEATGRTELFNQAGIFDVANNKIWTYYENDGIWHYVNAGGAVVTAWATGVAGIVTGAEDTEENAGKIFAETDGTGSVLGWDATQTAISNNTSAIEALGEDKEDKIEAGTTDQYFRGDKTWATLDKAAVGLDRVDNSSDADKKYAFTGEIVSGNNGFTTGNDVFEALAEKADSADLPKLYPTKGQSTDGAMTQKAVTDELNKCTYYTDEIIVENIEA